MITETHVHQWSMVTHWDSCHAFGTSYACACGATASTESERDVKFDEYAVVWLDPDGEETGREGGCQRCRELLAGAEPLHRESVMEGGEA